MKYVLSMIFTVCFCSSLCGQSSVPGYQGVFGGIENFYFEFDAAAASGTLPSEFMGLGTAQISTTQDPLPGGFTGGIRHYFLDPYTLPIDHCTNFISRGISVWVKKSVPSSNIHIESSFGPYSPVRSLQLYVYQQGFSYISIGHSSFISTCSFPFTIPVLPSPGIIVDDDEPHHVCLLEWITPGGDRLARIYLDGVKLLDYDMASSTLPSMLNFILGDGWWDGIHTFEGVVPTDQQVFEAYKFILPDDFIRGDVDGSGHPLNIADMILLYEYLAGNLPITCLNAADVNDDNIVDISDPVYLSNYIFSLGPLPPAPFPYCGKDSATPGTLGCVAVSVCP